MFGAEKCSIWSIRSPALEYLIWKNAEEADESNNCIDSSNRRPTIASGVKTCDTFSFMLIYTEVVTILLIYSLYFLLLNFCWIGHNDSTTDSLSFSILYPFPESLWA